MRLNPIAAGLLLLLLLAAGPALMWLTRDRDIFRMQWLLTAEHDTVALTISDLDPALPLSRVDIDCNGDGRYEYVGRSAGSYVCRGARPGPTFIVIRGRMQHLDLGAAGDLEDPFNDPHRQEDGYAQRQRDEAAWRRALKSCGGAKLVQIEQWGTNRWVSMRGLLAGCGAVRLPADAPDLSQARDLSYAFAFSPGFNAPLSDWDVGRVQTLKGAFMGSKDFNQDLSRWDTSSCTDLESTFEGAKAFNQDIGGWDTAKVRSMFRMFAKAEAFDQDLGAWDTAQVRSMTGMFAGAKAFNQDIGGWDVSKVQDMDMMFQGAKAFNQDLGRWDTRQLRQMIMMFAGARGFKQDLSGWKLPKITAAWDAFKHCPISKKHRPKIKQSALH